MTALVTITLIGPADTQDLAVDADTPLAQLLPTLLARVVDASETVGNDRRLVGPRRRQAANRGRADARTGGRAGRRAGVRAAQRRRPRRGRRSGPRRPATASGSPLARTRALLSTAAPRRGIGGSALGAAIGSDARNDLLKRVVADAPLTRCVTIAVVSPKGGVGKTTLSILLGETLCELRTEHVLAMDGDSDYGSLGRVRQTAPNGPGGHRDDEIFSSLASGAVTFAELDRTLWALPGGLRIVPSPRDPRAMARADRAVYTRVIGNLQRLAGVLVIDCGTGLGQDGVQAALLACDQIVLVTEPTGATASLAVEAFSLLERAGRPITVAANRLRRGRAGDEDLARMDASFPRAGALVGIPEDPAVAQSAGRPAAPARRPRAAGAPAGA